MTETKSGMSSGEIIDVVHTYFKGDTRPTTVEQSAYLIAAMLKMEAVLIESLKFLGEREKGREAGEKAADRVLEASLAFRKSLGETVKAMARPDDEESQ
ncbi:hypothetical protein MOV76_15420 [Rhizobium sp. PRIMUS64]|uniref:hypothetical protein n=1 Tax=Rhizobium sp. PRIMUS64 TaxID=2908925 RepID=UPI001FF1283C|nr:hypothetical protein [Rhizobium sp. PRIMUS64]MCJ9692996.1 hypothetical protein [Rhizobium sp. PRIMUS64]